MDKKITILHLWSSFKGDYELFNQVVMGLKDGYHHIICFMTGEPPLREVLCDAGYDVRWLRYKDKSLRRFQSGVVTQLSALVAENQVDIIHAHRHKATFYAALTARKHTQLKVVSSVHGLERSRGVFRKISNRLLWPRLTKIIAVSGAVKKDILKENSWFPAERVEVVYNGINIERFKDCGLDQKAARSFFDLPEQAWIWGAVGRLAPVKGHETLLKAWAGAGLGKLGCHLALAGDGDLHASLTALADELGIVKEITFLGHISEVPKFLKALDGFVMPSLHEGFPLAVLEALAAQLPVVASAVGGIPEILTELATEGHAFLVSARDDKEFGRAMAKVVSWSDEAYRQARGHVSKHIQRFAAQGMLDHMAKLYQDVVVL
ncbi:MAG: glycosyltransferase [Proteobacteria bacterium]|nr:glycosyltransferase [Pseudomonadota bacterium]MBU1641558.1 glycosyltransferase [Pseudomonadota bacterium]